MKEIIFSSKITIQIQNESGYPVPLTSDAEVYLASTSLSGKFYNNNTAGAVVINKVTIPSGSSTASFYFKDIKAGNYNISASHPIWTSASQPILVQDTIPPDPPVVITPSVGQVLTQRRPIFSGTSELDTTVLITLEGLTYTTSVDAQGNWSLTWPTDLANGNYTATAIARDEYGNDSSAVLRNFSVLVPTPTPDPPTPTPDPPKPKHILGIDIAVNKISNHYDNAQKDIKANVLINTDMSVLAYPSLDKPVKSVIGYFSGVKYVFSDDDGDGIYDTKMTTPLITGHYDLKIVVVYEDGEVEEIDMVILVDPYGYVYELVGGSHQRLQGVVVVLWVYKDGKWRIWDAGQYDQINPQLTALDGEFAFIVPEGLYYLTAEKSSYVFYKSHTMYVSNGNPININIKMDRIGIAGIVQDVVQWFKDMAKEINIFLAPFVYSDFAQNTYVPVSVATALSIVLLALVSQLMNLSLLSPFGSIFARLGMFFGAIPRRKKSWGMVYDAENHKPLAMVIVQIFDKQFGKLLETQVTDKDGRFGFLVNPGEYYIKAIKKNYAFPSKLVEQDYRGQVVKISDKQILNINIPMDPDIGSLTKRLLNMNNAYRVLNVLRLILLVVGTFYAFSFAVIEYNTINIIIFILYAVAWINEIYLKIVSAKAFSKVYDQKKVSAIDLGIVRVFDKNGKIVATKVSDTAGHFAFLVNKGEYHLTITKPEYEQYKSEDMKFNKGDVIRKKFGIKPRTGNV